MAEATISTPPNWESSATDPKDETFGDVVERAVLDAASATGSQAADATPADAFDAVLLGEPYDGAVIGRRGAREGPAAIREALAGVKTHHVDAGPAGRVGDLGDIAWPTDAVDLDEQADVGD